MNPDDSKQMDAMLSEHDDNTRKLEALMRDGPLPTAKPDGQFAQRDLRVAHAKAGMTATELRGAMRFATPVEAIVLLPLIAQSVHLQQQIGALLNAMKARE